MDPPQVQLFVTCLVDALAPEVGRATVATLERSGCTVAFPAAQGCCG
ncbi:MAG TPA: heterodisulfide reductase-related iron-sulfur binding cluster, partial [Acidimicrobiia bacterium]